MKALLLTLVVAMALTACGKKKANTTPAPVMGDEKAQQERENGASDSREESSPEPSDDTPVNASEDPCMGGE